MRALACRAYRRQARSDTAGRRSLLKPYRPDTWLLPASVPLSARSPFDQTCSGRRPQIHERVQQDSCRGEHGPRRLTSCRIRQRVAQGYAEASSGIRASACHDNPAARSRSGSQRRCGALAAQARQQGCRKRRHAARRRPEACARPRPGSAHHVHPPAASCDCPLPRGPRICAAGRRSDSQSTERVSHACMATTTAQQPATT